MIHFSALLFFINLLPSTYTGMAFPSSKRDEMTQQCLLFGFLERQKKKEKKRKGGAFFHFVIENKGGLLI